LLKTAAACSLHSKGSCHLHQRPVRQATPPPPPPAPSSL
jgi:hypothetical protein